jgi:hypothetical protein
LFIINNYCREKRKEKAVMNRAHCWLFVWAGLALVSLCAGCKTPPEPAPPPPPPQKEIVEIRLPPERELVNVPLTMQPITAKLLNLKDVGDLRGYQYYISNTAILFRESNELQPKNVGTALELTSAFTRDMVTIEGMTRGEVIRSTNEGGKRTLYVSFELDREKALPFTQNSDGYFDLDMHNGTIKYGRESYQIMAQMIPRLLIKTESRSDIQDYNHYAPGREVGDSVAGSDGLSDTSGQFLPDDGGLGSGRGYHIQVGSYLDFDNARMAFDRLSSAGFRPAYETYGDYFRVIVPGISAPDMNSTIRQLEHSGFSNLWIRENY